jgi:hypothetical protein
MHIGTLLHMQQIMSPEHAGKGKEVDRTGIQDTGSKHNNKEPSSEKHSQDIGGTGNTGTAGTEDTAVKKPEGRVVKEDRAVKDGHLMLQTWTDLLLKLALGTLKLELQHQLDHHLDKFIEHVEKHLQSYQKVNIIILSLSTLFMLALWATSHVHSVSYTASLLTTLISFVSISYGTYTIPRINIWIRKEQIQVSYYLVY